MNIFICDLGATYMIETSISKSLIFTPQFASPETFLDDE